MSYPSLSINLRIIENNTRELVRLYCDKGVIPIGLSKLVDGSEPIVRAMILGGIQTIGDTQIQNLMKLKDLPIRKMLLRRPLLSEVDHLVHHADISLHCERTVLEALSLAAVKANKRHEVIILHDLGEDTLDDSETESLAQLVLMLPGLTFIGIGSHLGCYHEVESMTDSGTLPVHHEEHAEWASCRNLDAISDAGVAGIVLMMPREGTPRFNQLRLGASLIMGEGLNDEPVTDISQAPIYLQAEVIEIKKKSSIYLHSLELDTLDDEFYFADRGARLRALCAIGKQDVDIRQLTPVDDGITIVGSSHNFLILDITDATSCYQVGDALSFYLTYGGVLQCITSEYVHKRYSFA
ncbi:alanine racemase [Photobacterium lipolyticum]|uniref:Cytoplasmic protein n=1 Tax=Photobacterium lipolyticum TaxID=266810 RepID=A0A2T3MVT7_9GAMM|nr:alanine racemase [Photobacterium lipolyticum]PSW04093.1 cytoplasmic protein [Photobacterium lipolyticum]